MSDTSMSGSMSLELLEVVERARREPEGRFHSLAHRIDVPALKRAYRRTRKSAAVAVDGVTKEQHGQNLEGTLQDLHARMKAKRRGGLGTSCSAVGVNASVSHGNGSRTCFATFRSRNLGSLSRSGVRNHEAHSRRSRMVEISLSGSGEGLGWVTAPGYSATAKVQNAMRRSSADPPRRQCARASVRASGQRVGAWSERSAKTDSSSGPYDYEDSA
jgi:hypothetical protein